jgi:hypothetical protein
MATKRPLRPFAAALLALVFLLPACGEAPHWHKDGVDENTIQGDLAACRKQAQAMYGPPGSNMSGGSQIDARFGPTGPSPADQVMREGQAVGNCMRGKGYVLRAAEAK